MEVADTAAENEYAVYVMKVDGNVVGQPEVSVKALPDSARQTLDAMSATGLVAQAEAMESLLTELGASAGDFFGHVDKARVFTQVDERIVPLRKM